MSARSMCTAVIATAAIAWSASATGVTCYVVMDRNDNVIYQSAVPPVDLSEQGAPVREAMRKRGDYLMFGDFENCPPVTFFTGAGGSRGLSLDEVVNGMAANGAAAAGPAPASGSTPAAPPTSAAPPSRKRR